MRLCLALILCLLLPACKSVEERRAPLVSASFKGHTPSQINRVVAEVFTGHGYTANRTGAWTIHFEREASLGSKILYGNWIEETPIMIRIRTRLTPVGLGVYRLDCEAYRVRDAGSSVEEEMPYGSFNKKHLQEILEECVAALKKPR